MARLVAERFHGRVEELVHQAVERLADLVAASLIQLRQLVEQSPQFVLRAIDPQKSNAIATIPSRAVSARKSRGGTPRL